MNEGFADLKNVDQWQISGMHKTLYWARYEKIVKGLKEFFIMLQQLHKKIEADSSGFQDSFFVSHEALLLSYEEALTRYVPSMGRWYNLGAHFLWIGDRTRSRDSAHIEYCRGIGNPIGVKVGSDCDPNDIVSLIKHLNPHNELGKINLITRFGSKHVNKYLPNLVQAIRDSGSTVTWSVDPMHGNTHKTKCGFKTRDFLLISDEIERTFSIHKNLGSQIGGVHLEMTHDSVTECLGGSEMLTASDLPKRYETWCDPRLSGAQALEISFLISSLMSEG
jgi:3-deoxy-7-phosphoheptulonate synthase